MIWALLTSQSFFSFFHLFLSPLYFSLTLALVHLSFLFYVLYIDICTKIAISAVLHIFPAILLFRYSIKLDLQVSRWCQMIALSSKGVGAFLFFCFWTIWQKLKIILSWRACIFVYNIFYLYISFPYPHFPLIPVVFWGVFQTLVSLNLFKGVVQISVWMPHMVLDTEDPRINKTEPCPEKHQLQKGESFQSQQFYHIVVLKSTFCSCFSNFHENRFSLNRFHPLGCPLFTGPLERWNN